MVNEALKVLVTGGTGLLGYNLVQALLEKGYTVYATYHKHSPQGLDEASWIRLDLEDPQQITRLFSDVEPDAIIHAAAYTDVDGCELHREKAYKINYLATMTIARQAAKKKSLLVYISTAYVFDREKGMYREDDTPNPINYYGLSKLLGEAATLSAMDEEKALIVRASGLYGYSPTGKRNFGISVVEKLLRGEEVKAFRDQYLSPTYVYFLSRRLIRALEKRIHGVLHLAGERLSRLEFAQLVARSLRADTRLIKPVLMKELTLPARRPRDSSLDTTIAKNLGLGLSGQEECIKHFVETYRRAMGV
jgi:dTDP-4-dehydrorhamnose reductase